MLRRLLDHSRGEVAHPYVPHAPLLLKLGHGAQGLLQGHVLARPVHQEEVYVVRPQLYEALAGFWRTSSREKSLGHTLVARKTSSRSTPNALIPHPTSPSLRYIWAVSICR